MCHYKHFTTNERECLLLGHALGFSNRKISKILGRSPSTVSRELKRNSSDGVYSCFVATEKYKDRRMNCKPKCKTDNPEIKKTIQQEIADNNLSPEEICNTVLKGQITCATVYNSINAGKLDLDNTYEEKRIKKHLFFKGKPRHKKGKEENRGKISAEYTIHDRPEEANLRLEKGHFEADTVLGKHKKSCLITLVERVSRYTVIVKINGKKSEEVRSALQKIIFSLPKKIKSITPDNGKEFSLYQNITKTFNIPFYFADPGSPWQRGSNEYTNRLIRYYIPKGTDIDKISEEKIKEIQDKLNNRPRKCLNWKTPNQVFNF